MSAKRTDLSRRELLSGAGAALGALVVLSACGKHRPVSCGVDNLSVDDALARTKLAYTETAPNPEKSCFTCNQWLPGPSADDCGHCKVVKGQIHPGGYCKAFALKS